ncbi:hypothetical protein Bbelb_116760 [Branchiostoma belcheri]|nr:hypothetical protein Bbelb_116760 [Branchiostoma belcheri]
MFLTVLTTDTTTTKYYRYYHYKIGLPISVTSRGILHYTDYSDFTTAAQILFFIILTTDTTGTATTKSGFPYLSPLAVFFTTLTTVTSLQQPKLAPCTDAVYP